MVGDKDNNQLNYNFIFSGKLDIQTMNQDEATALATIAALLMYPEKRDDILKSYNEIKEERKREYEESRWFKKFIIGLFD